eukprot:660443-Amorphochlora_amoeboformis.AAC.1
MSSIDLVWLKVVGARSGRSSRRVHARRDFRALCFSALDHQAFRHSRLNEKRLVKRRRAAERRAAGAAACQWHGVRCVGVGHGGVTLEV